MENEYISVIPKNASKSALLDVLAEKDKLILEYHYQIEKLCDERNKLFTVLDTATKDIAEATGVSQIKVKKDYLNNKNKLYKLLLGCRD